MHPPLRLLNEINVFMDMMNRKQALKAIVDYATGTRKFQYVLLTPSAKGSPEELQRNLRDTYGSSEQQIADNRAGISLTCKGQQEMPAKLGAQERPRQLVFWRRFRAVMQTECRSGRAKAT
jgi:hypothetical protein